MNAAAFFYDYEGLQYQATDPEVFQGGVGNIPESEIFGAELGCRRSSPIPSCSTFAWLG